MTALLVIMTRCFPIILLSNETYKVTDLIVHPQGPPQERKRKSNNGLLRKEIKGELHSFLLQQMALASTLLVKNRASDKMNRVWSGGNEIVNETKKGNIDLA